jgi:hypothetical protein
MMKLNVYDSAISRCNAPRKRMVVSAFITMIFIYSAMKKCEMACSIFYVKS